MVGYSLNIELFNYLTKLDLEINPSSKYINLNVYLTLIQADSTCHLKNPT